MALARPTEPSDACPTGSSIRSTPSTPVLTVAMATKPAAHLRGGDRRRLARHISGVERRVRQIEPTSGARTRLIRRLWELADRASRAPASTGLALVAGDDEGRHLVFHHPTIDRVIVGPSMTDDEVVEATWGFGRLAVLHLSARGSRLICSDGASLWEPRPPWDPLGLQSNLGLDRADLLVRSALPHRTPLLVAGDDRLVDAYRDRGLCRPVVAVLPGDHSETSATTLAALAQRTLRRALDHEQRSAMVSLALAVDRGQAARGLEAVRAAVPETHDVLLVEHDALEALGDDPVRWVRRVGTVVTVPDGFLTHHDHAALVPDHRVRAGALPAVPPVDDDLTVPRDLRLVEGVH